MSENQYVTATEAMRLLDVSKGKMAKLLKTGEIPYTIDPRNERAKLIKRSDIDIWLAKTIRPKVPHQRNVPAATSNNLERQITYLSRTTPGPGPDDEIDDIQEEDEDQKE